MLFHVGVGMVSKLSYTTNIQESMPDAGLLMQSAIPIIHSTKFLLV